MNAERRAASGHCVRETVHRSKRSPESVHGGWSPRSPCPGHRAPVELPDSGGALWWAWGLNTIRQPRYTAAAGHCEAQLSFSRRGAPRRLFFLYSIAVPVGVHRRSPGARPGHGRRGTATAVHSGVPGHTMELPDSGGALPWAHGCGSSFAVEPRSWLFFLYSIAVPTGVHRRSSRARLGQPGEPAAAHCAPELSSGRRGASRWLFFMYSTALPEPVKC